MIVKKNFNRIVNKTPQKKITRIPNEEDHYFYPSQNDNMRDNMRVADLGQRPYTTQVINKQLPLWFIL